VEEVVNMLHIWMINISLVIVSVIIAVLISLELFSTRDVVKSKLTALLFSLGLILVLQEVVLLASFMMWSEYDNPIYAYPSAVIASLDLVGLIILYLVIKV
jgi:hypothetical protein